MKDLLTCRDEIDTIDTKILKLLKDRMEIAKDIANYKLNNNQSIIDKQREQAKLNTLMHKAQTLGLSSILINEIYSKLMAQTVSFEQSHILSELNKQDVNRDTSIAYLGTIGTYSHLAAFTFLDNYHGNIKGIGCQSFDEIISTVECGKSEYAVLPIENSSSGNINDVLDVMQNTKAHIVGELFYPIDHSILALDTIKLDEIEEIYSHPQPVSQCSHWLKSHLPNVKINYTNASSEAMQKVIELNNKHIVALGSANAAKYYKLHSLVTDIANNIHNYTRFIALSMTPIIVPDIIKAKTSITFSVAKYQPGSLINVLNEFSRHHINLTKLHSRPKESDNKETWEEIFFADIEANLNTPQMQDIISNITHLTSNLKILGCYPNNEKK